MLKKFGVALAGALMVAFTTSCGNDSSQAEFSLGATIDGGKFKASAVQAFTDSIFVTITGASSAVAMVLHLDVPTVPSRVSLSDTTADGNYAAVTVNGNTWSTVYGGSGTATFTTTNANEASGTFHFIAASDPGVALGPRTVTSGTFVVRFAK